MIRLPPRDGNSRTGSSLPPPQSPSGPEREMRARLKAKQQVGRRWSARLRAVVTRAQLRTARGIIEELRRDYHEKSLALGTERKALEANRERFRRRLRRELGLAIPRYGELRKLLRQRQREIASAGVKPRRAAAAPGGLVLGTPDALDSPSALTVTAPYPVYEQSNLDFGGTLQDDSYLMPRSGHFVQQYDFVHDDAIFITQLYGWGDLGGQMLHLGFGATYVTPGAGRLRVRAELQNFYFNFHFGVVDVFGFSDAELEIEVGLYTHVRHGLVEHWYRHPVLTDGLTSFGTDMAFQMLPLDNSRPHTLDYVWPQPFPAGASLQVTAGVYVDIYSLIDDMQTNAGGNGGWQLRRLTVDMTP